MSNEFEKENVMTHSEYCPISEKDKVDALSHAALMFLNMTMNDGEVLTYDELVSWVNNTYGVETGMIIVDELINNGKIKQLDEHMVLTSEGIIMVVETINIMYKD